MEMNFIPSNWVPQNSNIKAIGVGGGGQNAVTYMYNQHIEGCTFIVCNTDRQALENSNVPVKIQLGNGLGAGCDPIKGRKAATEAMDEIEEKVLNTGTEMLFITAGMGGGTGTGAAPVIARMAKDKGILTVGVVTIPFRNDGPETLAKAKDGIEELEKHVDSLILIDNEKLYEVYGNLNAHEAYPKTDEVLATAVRCIVEIIKKEGYVNVDMEDVKTMMSESGIAIMGMGTGTGEDRLFEAVKGAIESPLLNDIDLATAKSILVNITGGHNDQGLKMSDLNTIDQLIDSQTGNARRFKRGLVYDYDPNFGDRVNITIIATGFDLTTVGGQDLDGDIIKINTDFVYSPQKDVTLYRTEKLKIGPNDSRNVPKFNFTEAPALHCSAASQSDMESIPAIKRIKN